MSGKKLLINYILYNLLMRFGVVVVDLAFVYYSIIKDNEHRIDSRILDNIILYEKMAIRGVL